MWLGESLIKHFKQPAPNQELLLAAFQEQDWAEHIDDPLPQQRDLDPRERLRDTVKLLNRSVRSWGLRFHVEQNGEAVRWELDL